jgi:hypothetical protein
VRKRRFLIIPARATPPLGGTRYARSDTIRTPLLFWHWRIFRRAKFSGFDKRYSHFAVSCPYRIRLASLPSRPSSARRPCLAISVLSSLTCANGPSDSNGGRILLKPSDGIVPSVISSNIFDNANRHPLRACNIGRSTEVPPDCGRSTSVTFTVRRFQHAK